MKLKIVTNFFSILVVLLLTLDYSLAEDLSLDRAIKLALLNSKDIQIAELNIQNTNNSLSLARAKKGFRINSSIDLKIDYINKEAVSFVHNYPDLNYPLVSRVYELENLFSHQIALNLNLVKPIYNSGKLNNITKAAQYDFDISKYKKRLLIRELRYLTNKAYHAALLSDILLKLSRESHDKALLNKKNLEDSIAKPSKVDLILTELHASVQKSELDEAEQLRQDNYRILKFICKIPDDELIVLAPDMGKLNVILNKEELKKSLEKHPELIIHNLMSSMHQHHFYAKKADRYPKLLAYLGYSGKWSSDEITFKKINDENIIYTGIKIETPIWDNGMTENIAQQEIVEKIKSDMSSFRCRDILEDQLESVVNKHNNNITIYKNHKKIIDSIQASYDISVAKFKVSQTNITELNNIESKMTQSIKRLHILKFEINILKAEIQKLVDTI